MYHLPKLESNCPSNFWQQSGRLRIQKILRWIEKTDVDIWALSMSNGSEHWSHNCCNYHPNPRVASQNDFVTLHRPKHNLRPGRHRDGHK